MNDIEKLNQWKRDNPEKLKANNKRRLKQWRLENPEKVKEQQTRSRSNQRAFYKKNKVKWRIRHYQKKYGITLKEYNEMLIKQNSKCAICKTENCSSGRHFAIDHDHQTGAVRGLLCKDCNIGIGMLKHNVIFLEAAMAYLKCV